MHTSFRSLPLIWAALFSLLAPIALGEPLSVGYVLVASSDADRRSSHFGRVEAVKQVDIRSMVSGTLQSWEVAEGQLVERGELLARIDDSVYRANLRAAEADLAQARASLELAQLEETRLGALRQRDAVSESEFDSARAMAREAEARVQAAQANLELRQIDLGYTRIVAPFSGKVGTFAVNEGSYLEESSGLTNLVQVDPVRVAITVSEAEFLAYRRAVRDLPEGAEAPVAQRNLLLADGSHYPYAGEFLFSANALNPATSTLPLHFQFANPDGLLVPGQFVEVITQRHRAQKLPAVPLASILTDARGDFVLVIDDDDRVMRRNVVIADRTAAEALVREGLQTGERVILQGLTKAKIGSLVEGELVTRDKA